MSEDKPSYYENALEQFNLLSDVEDRKAFYNLIDFSTLVEKKIDSMIIQTLKVEKDLMDVGVIKNVEDNPIKELMSECASLIATRHEDDATELIVQHIEKNNNIYSTRNDLRNEVWFYDKGIYKPNGKTKIQELTRKVLGYIYTPQRVNKIIAKIEADTLIDEDDFFNTNNINEIPVQNGILNLITLELEEFTPKKIFFNKLPVKYDVDAKCENIDKFLSEVLKDPHDKDVMYQKFGYDLYKEHFIEKATMFVGDGRNGKGKLLALKKNFLGSENCCSVSLNQMHSGSTSVCELYGKLVNIAGDLSNNAFKDTGLFKEITGRDPIGAKRKYLNDLNFVNYSKQYFACNELPKVYDRSLGFYSRWDLFEFPYTFVSQGEYDMANDKTNLKIKDERVIDKIIVPEELSGLLNKALEGLKIILEKGDFSYTKGTKDVKDFWIRKSDSFAAFCLDMLDEDVDGHISKKDLRQAFKKYHKKHGVKGASDRAIKVALEDNYGVVEERIIVNKLIDGYGDWCWSGIKWRVN